MHSHYYDATDYAGGSLPLHTVGRVGGVVAAVARTVVVAVATAAATTTIAPMTVAVQLAPTTDTAQTIAGTTSGSLVSHGARNAGNDATVATIVAHNALVVATHNIDTVVRATTVLGKCAHTIG